MQPAPLCRLRILHGRPEKTGVGRRRVRQGVRAERVWTQRVRLLSRHAVRQTRRVPDPIQGQRKLFRNLRTEVNLELVSTREHVIYNKSVLELEKI